jgi:endonuclease/exonuclease/phosphatase family metal-dependent hydrolase
MLRFTRATVAGLLVAAGCVHPRPAAFDASRISELSCRQLQPPAAPSPRWITPPDTDSRLRLARWCETVGPVFFKPYPALAARRSVDRMAIVSWNIHEGRGDVRDLIRRLRLGEFTDGEPIDEFALLLQEVTRRDPGVPPRIPPGYPAPRRIAARSDAPDGDVVRLALGGYAVLYAPSMRNGERNSERGGGAEDRGNAIVSTLPLSAPALIELPLERQRRVAVVAAIDGRTGAGKPWHLGLVDVHLDTAFSLFHGGPFAARRRQMTALLDGLRGSPAVREGDTAVIAGDLNTWMGRREPAVGLLRDEFPEAQPADLAATWTGPLGLHASLDHIFVRSPLSPGPVRRLPSRFGSDHYPLLTVVRF